jgi:hypothetical protein
MASVAATIPERSPERPAASATLPKRSRNGAGTGTPIRRLVSIDAMAITTTASEYAAVDDVLRR